MAADYTYRLCKDYVHIKLGEGYEITPQTARKFWSEIAEICRTHRYRRVLSEGNLPKRRLKTIDAFESASQISESSAGLAVAICFYGYQTDQTSEFFKTVAANRGVHIEFFDNLEAALKWLGVFENQIDSEMNTIL